MILIADGGSTKVDWVAIKNKKEVFRIQTLGLNPNILSESNLKKHLETNTELTKIKNFVTEIYFYGAGCGTTESVKILTKIFENFFKNAIVFIEEDTIGAVYACTDKPAIVGILGTGSNSCFFDGKIIVNSAVSLGYTIMDEGSGNYFGKKLLRDYFYKKMPLEIAKYFEKNHNLNPDFIKQNLYQEPNPNKYLASFAKIMLTFKDNIYIQKMLKKGFNDFFKFRILPFKNHTKTPIYFVGSIAYFFKDILQEVAKKHDLKITKIIQRPIDKLVVHHTKDKA